MRSSVDAANAAFDTSAIVAVMNPTPNLQMLKRINPVIPERRRASLADARQREH